MNEPLSAVTGRSIEEIAAGKGRKRVWHSNRAAASAVGADKTQPPQSPAVKPWRGRKQRPLRQPRLKRRAQAASASPGFRSAEPRHAAQRRRRAGTNGCTRSSSTATASKPGSITARYDCSRAKVWTGRIVSSRSRRRLPALPPRPRCSTANWWSEDEKGVSSFSLLQTDLKDGRSDRLVYYVFDLLYLDGRDLTGEPLIERKAALERLLKVGGPERPHPLHRTFRRGRRD